MKHKLLTVLAVTLLLTTFPTLPAQALNRTAFLTFSLLGQETYTSPARTSVLVDGNKQWALELPDVAQDGKVYWLPDVNKLLLDNATIETEKADAVIISLKTVHVDILLKGSNTISGQGSLISTKGSVTLAADDNDSDASLTLNTPVAALQCATNLTIRNIQLVCTTSRYVLMCTGSMGNNPTLTMQNVSANLRGTKSCIQGFKNIVTIGCGLPYNEYEDQRIYYDKKKGTLTHNEQPCLEIPFTNSETYIPVNTVPLAWGWSSEKANPEEPGGYSEAMTEEASTMDEAPMTEEAPVVEEEPSDEDKIFEVTEVTPQYGENSLSLMKYISENMRYPAFAEEQGIQGRVLVRFVVETDGTISNFEVLHSPDNCLEKEARRLIESAPGEWLPARQHGKPVRSRMTVPITFRLTKK